MKNLLSLLAAVIALSFFVNCGGGGSSGGDYNSTASGESKGVIGYTSKDLSNPFFNIIGDTLKKEAAKHG